jgi:hypothetical protein
VPYWTRKNIGIYMEFGCLEIGYPTGRGGILLFPRNLVVWKLGALLNEGVAPIGKSSCAADCIHTTIEGSRNS